MTSALYVPAFMADAVLFLAEWRARKGWSQAQLAREAGVSRTTVSNLELGKASGIEWPTLDALARALDVSRAALFEPPPKGRGH